MGNKNFTINPETTMHAEDVQIAATVMVALERLLATIPNLKHWKFILEDIKCGEIKPHFVLSYTSVEEGEDCADAKMITLVNHTEICTTGELRHDTLPYGEVSYFGGIRIRYDGFEPAENSWPTQHVDGEFRIVFSGANEAVDQMIVLAIAKAYKEVCDLECIGSAYFYDFEPLKNEQLSGCLMALIGLK